MAQRGPAPLGSAWRCPIGRPITLPRCASPLGSLAVRSFTITNSRFTPFAVEDTVYLQFAIAKAGIRAVRFQLPAEMRDARITAPLLRQKTFEPVADQPGRIRVTLELQDEVTEQLIVLVEHDRALTGNTYDAPIPIVETGSTEPAIRRAGECRPRRIDGGVRRSADRIEPTTVAVAEAGRNPW